MQEDPAEQLVALKAETLPTIADALPYPAYVVTPDGVIVAMNSAAAQSPLRHGPFGTQSTRVVDHFTRACRAVLMEALVQATRTGETIAARIPAEGNEAMCIVHPILGDRTAVHTLALFVLPAKSGHRSEVELRESEERYRKLVELLPDAIMVHAAGRVEYLNPAGARLWGGDSPRVFVGMSYWDLVHPDDRAFVKERVHRIEQGLESPLREYRIVRLDGGVVPVEAAGTLISYRGKPANLVMFRDITARKEAEAKLRDTLARYHSLFEDSPISLWEEDWSGFVERLHQLRDAGHADFASYLSDHPEELSRCFSLLRLKDANRACVRFYGAHNRAELMANMEKLFPEESDIIRKSLIAASRGQHHIVSEGLTRTLTGEERHVIYYFSVLPGHEDTWETVLASVMDLTAQKQVERRLTEVNAQLEKEEAERRLLSQRLMDMIENDRRSLAMELHDHFGQMTTTLKMDLEIIAAGLADADPVLRSRAEDAAAKATKTIADLKSLASGLMPSVIEDLGLIPALQALIDDIGTSTDLEIHFFTGEIPNRFDREKELALYRIAQESITNVVKHAGARRVYVNLIEKHGVVSLSIEDDGVGFAFDEEATALWSGGPLGMNIMRARAAQFGGELTIDSRPGHGVHVLAEIPL